MRLITGKAKSGKSQRVYQELMQRLHEQPKGSILLIVPEQYTLEAEKQLIHYRIHEDDGLPGLLGIEVVSFRRLAQRFAQEASAQLMDDLGCRLLLRKALQAKEDSLVLYRHAAHRDGFLNKMGALIAEFKQNGVTPEALSALCGAYEGTDLLRYKLKDFSLIYAAYEAEKGNHSDLEDVYSALMRRIPEVTLLSGADIWIDGFDSFTLQELEILGALMETAHEVSITLCTDGQLHMFEHTEAVRARLIERAEALSVPVETIALNGSFGNPELMHLAENIMAYPIVTRAGVPDAVRLFSSGRISEEIEHCAEALVQCVSDSEGALTWRDIAVVTGNLESYGGELQRIFSTYGIPVFVDEKNMALHHPLLRYIEAFIELHMAPHRRNAMLALLKTGFWAYDDEAIAAFEWYAQAHGMKLQAPITQEAETDVSVEVLNAIREDLLACAQTPMKGTVSDVVESLYRELVARGIPESLERQSAAFMETERPDRAQEFAQIWNKTVSLFDQMVTLMGSETVDLKAILDILRTGFSGMEIGRIPLWEDSVLVGSVDRSRAHPIKVLFLLGVNDGVLPETARDAQLFSEREKSVLKSVSPALHLVSDGDLFEKKERFSIYYALTRPSQRLYMSYARSDASGSALQPSVLIRRALRCFSELTCAVLTDQWHMPSTPQGTYGALALQMRRHRDGEKLSPLWRAVAQWYRRNASDDFERLLRALSYDNRVAPLSPEQVENTYAAHLITSVSRLEHYVQCPFRYFVESGLKPVEEKRYVLQAPDVGIHLHRILERFGRTVYDKGLNWHALSPQEVRTLVKACVDDVTADPIFCESHQYGFLAHKMHRIAQTSIETMVAHVQKGGFVPTAFEMPFSRGGIGLPAIDIPLSGEKSLYIRGVIDRVDTVTVNGRSYVRVIDYKSGQKGLKLSEVYHGLQLQLMVYLSAWIRGNGGTTAPGGAFYYHIDDPMLDTSENRPEVVEALRASEMRLNGLSSNEVAVIEQMDPELLSSGKSTVFQAALKGEGDFTATSAVASEADFKRLVRHAERRIQEIGNDLQGGDIRIAPCKLSKGSSCTYCPYRGICQFEPTLPGNVYRHFEALKDAEVLERLRKQEDIADVD